MSKSQGKKQPSKPSFPENINPQALEQEYQIIKHALLMRLERKGLLKKGWRTLH